MKKFILIAVTLLLAIPSVVFAHGGGTDANGGHHDYNNVSGLGSYHYHHGYGPHLHDNGVCPYEGNQASTVTYSSYDDEEYSFTEDELHDYVYDSVMDNPSAFNVVPIETYEELKKDYDLLEKNYNSLRQSSIDSDKATDNVLTAIGIVGAIGCIACYYIYRKYHG